MQHYIGTSFGPESHAVAALMIHQSHSGTGDSYPESLESDDPVSPGAGIMHGPKSQKSWRLTVAGAVAQSHS